MFSLSRKEDYDLYVEGANHEIKISASREFVIAIFASLNQKRYVFISKKNRNFDLERFQSKHYEFGEDFIFLNFSIRSKLKSFSKPSESISFSQISQIIKKLVN